MREKATSFAQWLQEIGLESYTAAFAENEVEFSVVGTLTEEDLRELGLSLGARKKFLLAAAALADSAKGERGITPPSEPKSVPLATPDSSTGERRQLTVMFCDLVGSTALSERLDPEELRALLHEYRMRCGEVIARYEGFVARYVGDGILTYFGWPKAHEEDAERSLRAALEIIQAVKGTSSAEPLSVRIGIATGPVVVGEQAGVGDQSKLAVGSTPNLAARLQGLAAADQIIIAASTRRLVGNSFELTDLGEHALKGISEPVHAWRVMAVSAAASRFEASHGAQVTPVSRARTRARTLARPLAASPRRRRPGGAFVRRTRHWQEPGIEHAAPAAGSPRRASPAFPMLALPRQQCVLSEHRQFRTRVEIQSGRDAGVQARQA